MTVNEYSVTVTGSITRDNGVTDATTNTFTLKVRPSCAKSSDSLTIIAGDFPSLAEEYWIDAADDL